MAFLFYISLNLSEAIKVEKDHVRFGKEVNRLLLSNTFYSVKVYLSIFLYLKSENHSSIVKLL